MLTYNFLQNNIKVRWVATLIAVTITVILIYNANTISDQNLYYYTFSTIVQGFLALVGFLGTVVIFKLQLLENDLNSLRDKSLKDMVYHRGTVANTYSWIETRNEMTKILETSPESTYIKIYAEKIDDVSNEKNNLRTRMVDFTILSFINISIALTGLPISKLLTDNEMKYIIMVYLILNIIISIYSLLQAFGLIRSSLGYSFKLTVSG